MANVSDRNWKGVVIMPGYLSGFAGAECRRQRSPAFCFRARSYMGLTLDGPTTLSFTCDQNRGSEGKQQSLGTSEEDVYERCFIQYSFLNGGGAYLSTNQRTSAVPLRIKCATPVRLNKVAIIAIIEVTFQMSALRTTKDIVSERLLHHPKPFYVSTSVAADPTKVTRM